MNGREFHRNSFFWNFLVYSKILETTPNPASPPPPILRRLKFFELARFADGEPGFEVLSWLLFLAVLDGYYASWETFALCEKIKETPCCLRRHGCQMSFSQKTGWGRKDVASLVTG